jgi:hypothetical protein
MVKTVRAVAIAALIALVLSGCGGSSGGERVAIDATPAGMARAAQATLAKNSSKVALSIEMSIQGRDITMSGTGAMDPSNRRFQMSFDAKDFFAALAGPEGDRPEVAALFEKPIEVLLDGTTLYMHLPALAAFAGDGPEWFKIDLSSTSDLGGLLGEGGGTFGSDPSSFLHFLMGAGKVTKVGDEDVRGVSTTHYSGSYTLDDALSTLKGDQREKVERAFKSLNLPDDARTQDMPFDAWIDADGLVRRVQTKIDYASLAPEAAAAGLGSMTQTVEYFDFGTKVEIQPPPDDQVQDLTALASSATSKFSSVASSIN